MPKLRLRSLIRLATLSETRGLIRAAATSTTLRAVRRRAMTDRAGLLRDLRNPANARALVRSAAAHPATRELADVGMTFLPMRYMPLGWVATLLTHRVLRRRQLAAEREARARELRLARAEGGPAALPPASTRLD